MQKLEGDGMTFLHAGGTVLERRLRPGEVLHVDTGCVVAFEKDVGFDIQQAGGIKTALFGGEGLFFATLQGPGRCWAPVPAVFPSGRKNAASGPATRRKQGRRLHSGRARRTFGRGQRLKYKKGGHRIFYPTRSHAQARERVRRFGRQRAPVSPCKQQETNSRSKLHLGPPGAPHTSLILSKGPPSRPLAEAPCSGTVRTSATPTQTSTARFHPP